MEKSQVSLRTIDRVVVDSLLPEPDHDFVPRIVSQQDVALVVSLFSADECARVLIANARHVRRVDTNMKNVDTNCVGDDKSATRRSSAFTSLKNQYAV
jgi:hypothetical protein